MAGLLEKNPSADKETDAMAWVGHMNMLKAMAEEIMDCSWNSRDFRNSMAHYKLGVALKKEELVIDDLLFGLTIKYFGVSYIDVKKAITVELENLSYQIK